MRPDDVLIDVAYCGICHTDIHQAREDWGAREYYSTAAESTFEALRGRFDLILKEWPRAGCRPRGPWRDRS